ncbi:7-carboxy-7-deazaguanine synthase QueE [Maritalea porphyrae]|nr:7-carboxy-7-deazaguanine synthase QueE [Maritalea porphyrae]MCZ4271823.1 7-carboxy-7-deazaguanine synthase QueE [Maritalea porphyrae]
MSENKNLIRVSELFGPTIQGEGAVIGQPTVFVRTGGCDFRCVWCDSLHAVDGEFRNQWTPMSSSQILDQVKTLTENQPIMITLSGGNPAIQPLGELIELGKSQGFQFAMETQGSIAKDWFGSLDVLVLSPKPPSSEMTFDPEALNTSIRVGRGAGQTVLKFVVFDDKDFVFAQKVAAIHPDLPVYLQPGNHTPPPASEQHAAIDLEGINQRMLWLIDKVNQTKWFSAWVLPQLHVMLWGNQRGV